MQVDETNFKATLGKNALDAMEIIINRSKNISKTVAEYRAAQGGLAALKRQVLQTSNEERGGCLPNEAETPLVGPSPCTVCCLPGNLRCQAPRCIQGALQVREASASTNASCSREHC